MIPKGLWATFLGFFVSRVNHLKNQPLTQKNKRQHWKLIGQFWMTQYLKIFVKPQGLQISTLEQVSMSSNACFVLRRPPSPGWLDDVRQIRLNLIWTGGVKHRGAMPLPPNSRRENFKMHFDGFNGWSEPTKTLLCHLIVSDHHCGAWGGHTEKSWRNYWNLFNLPFIYYHLRLIGGDTPSHHPQHPSSDRCRAAKAPRKSIRFIEISRLCNDTPCTFGKLEMPERDSNGCDGCWKFKRMIFEKEILEKTTWDKDVTTKYGNWLQEVYITDKVSLSYIYIFLYDKQRYI